MILLSVVTGTYNRLNYLASLVTSIRNSVCRLPYEIVIVDGGSNDGTIEWCMKQPDVKFIEHGALLGAVKAFNDGAYSSVGKYVVLANDDVEFIDESLLAAYSFMEDNPTVGIGCFWQNRNNKSWHVESMSATTHDGRKAYTHYGQVCIVPRELGNKVGWWGNYLRTYGGDNELSCNIIELGYQVKPVPCACINDLTPMDDLRKINNPNPTTSHPDSLLWVKKWTRGGNLGPRFPEIWKHRNFNKDFRILYAPIYEKDSNIQKTQKRGLRMALSKVASVVEVDYIKTSLDYVHDVGLSFRPNMFLFQLHHSVSIDTITAIRKEFPNSILVNWNGDYNKTLFSREYVEYLKMFDLTGLVTTSVDKLYKMHGVNHFYWQIGYEDSDAVPDSRTPKHDVLFMGNAYTNDRLEFGKFLRSLPYNVGLYGHWPRALKPSGYTLYNFDVGAQLYKNCKVAISDNQWTGATGFVSNRLFQVMSAGALLLQQHFDGMEELLGLKDGVHLVVWNSLQDLHDKIVHYVINSNDRNRIAKRGMEFIRKNHSFDVRVKELFDELKRRGIDLASSGK